VWLDKRISEERGAHICVVLGLSDGCEGFSLRTKNDGEGRDQRRGTFSHHPVGNSGHPEEQEGEGIAGRGPEGDRVLWFHKAALELEG